MRSCYGIPLSCASMRCLEIYVFAKRRALNLWKNHSAKIIRPREHFESCVLLLCPPQLWICWCALLFGTQRAYSELAHTNFVLTHLTQYAHQSGRLMDGLAILIWHIWGTNFKWDANMGNIWNIIYYCLCLWWGFAGNWVLQAGETEPIRCCVWRNIQFVKLLISTLYLSVLH